MAVTEHDQVSGELVVLALPGKDGEPGPQLAAPSGLANKVKVKPHSDGEYRGSQLFFTELTFAELQQLSTALGTYSTRYRLSLQRNGGLVSLSGSVDLTSLSPDRTDVQITVKFPGRIASTNGKINANNISWTPKAGQITELNATVSYADNSAASWWAWAWGIILATIAVAIAVAAMAFFAHRRQVADVENR